jgi:two-component system sensor histidine kinase DegS
MLNYRMKIREQEHEVMAHDIHDGAYQYLAAAQAVFDSFCSEGRTGSPGDWSSYDKGRAFLSHGIDELRRVLRGLGPMHLAAGNLPKALECLFQEVRVAGGPKIEFYHDIQSSQISSRLELAAYRIVQECVINACRHSKSEKILVGITRDDESLCIQVQDWGIGFDIDGTPPGRFGLEGIRRRAELLGGITTIHSEVGSGTLITVELPLMA